MIKRNPIMAARRNPTMVANPPTHYGRYGRKTHMNPLHYLKNPGDIQIAGIKVLPLAGGTAVAIAIKAGFDFIPFLANLGASNKYLKGLAPALATVAAAWGVHTFVGKKYPGKYGMVKDIAAQTAAVGIVLAVQGMAQQSIIDGVASVAAQINKNAKSQTAVTQVTQAAVDPNAKGFAGGGFRSLAMNGGGFVPALQGGQFNAFNKPFNPIEGTAMQGFVMQGGRSDSPPMGLGARMARSLGGIDLDTFAD
jgi:hypothetical protein